MSDFLRLYVVPTKMNPQQLAAGRKDNMFHPVSTELTHAEVASLQKETGFGKGLLISAIDKKTENRLLAVINQLVEPYDFISSTLIKTVANIDKDGKRKEEGYVTATEYQIVYDINADENQQLSVFVAALLAEVKFDNTTWVGFG